MPAQPSAGVMPWRRAIKAAAHLAAHRENAQKGRSTQGFLYRWEHVQAVVRLALRLAELAGADRQVVEAAAWLHDVAKLDAEDHGQSGASAARHILAETDFPKTKIDAVADAIAKHVGLFTDQPVEPLEAAVLWDADKLTKLGATAVIHFCGAMIAHQGASTKQILRQLPGSGWQEKTVVSLQTAPARAAGKARLAAFEAFYRQAAREFDGMDLTAAAEDVPPGDEDPRPPHQPQGGDGVTTSERRPI